MIELKQGDCVELIKSIKSKSIDLILTDPPYLIENTTAGGNSDFSKSFQKMNTEIQDRGLTGGFNINLLDEFMRVMKVPNIYIYGVMLSKYLCI